jgi:hypothetical protein
MAAAPFVMAAMAVYKGISDFKSAKAEQKNAKNNATQALALAAENEKRQRIASLQNQGKGRAAAGSQGGTALDYGDLFESNAIYDELDALTVRHRGAVEANNFRNQARAAGAKATGAIVGAGFSVAQSFMGGGMSGSGGAGSSLYGSGGGWFGSGNSLGQGVGAQFSSSPTGPYKSYGI